MRRLGGPGIFLCLVALALPAVAETVTFPNFCTTTGMTLNGSAAGLNPNGDCALRLTNNLGQSGSAFRSSTISLASDASFSTFFSFRISNPIGASDNDGVGADGIVFVVQTVASNVGGAGGGIGYAGINNSVGIEFDTWNNGLPGDPNGNHVGIDLNGSVNSVVTANIPTRMNDGDIWYAWVDYNGVTDQLELRLSMSTTRPTDPTLSTTVNLPAILGSTNAYIGFTSGTGAAGGTHDILSWQFNGFFAPIGETPQVPVPSASTEALFILASLLALGGLIFLRAR